MEALKVLLLSQDEELLEDLSEAVRKKPIVLTCTAKPEMAVQLLQKHLVDVVVLSSLFCQESIVEELRRNKGFRPVFLALEDPHGSMNVKQLRKEKINAKMIRKSKNPLGKTIPIIAMTANAFTEDENASLACGMNAHISKPIDMALLERTIRRLKSQEENYNGKNNS